MIWRPGVLYFWTDGNTLSLSGRLVRGDGWGFLLYWPRDQMRPGTDGAARMPGCARRRRRYAGGKKNRWSLFLSIATSLFLDWNEAAAWWIMMMVQTTAGGSYAASSNY